MEPHKKQNITKKEYYIHKNSEEERWGQEREDRWCYQTLGSIWRLHFQPSSWGTWSCVVKQPQLCRECHLSGMGNKFMPGQKSLAEFKSLGDSAEDSLSPPAAEKVLQHSGPLHSGPLPCLSGLRKGMCLNLTSKAKQIV